MQGIRALTPEEKEEIKRHRKKFRRNGMLRKAPVRKAIRNSFGNISNIAEKVGSTNARVLYVIKKYPDLQIMLNRERAALLSEAECQLALAVKRGDQWAIDRVLENDGSHYANRKNVAAGAVPTLNIQNNTISFTPQQYIDTLKKAKEIKGVSIKLPEVNP